MAALVFPTAAQAALQTPINTFSPTSTPLVNGSNSFTYVYDTTLGIWTGTAGGGGSSVSAATAAEAAAGTITTSYSSPATAVPKDAAGMTGAALLPGGDDGERPATLVEGMLRYNNQAGPPAVLEFYDGSAWQTVSTGGGGLNNVIFGTITGGTSTTITTVSHAAVDPAKSYVIINGGWGGGAQSLYQIAAYVSSRSATSFDITTTSTGGGVSDPRYSYQLVY
jgi:hypothetical protein